MTTSRDHDSRPKLVTSIAVRKYIKVNLNSKINAPNIGYYPNVKFLFKSNRVFFQFISKVEF